MANPERGICSPEVYEAGKKHLVTPERLCVNGLYTLMTFAMNDRFPYIIVPATVKNVVFLSEEYIEQVNELHIYQQPMRTGSARVDLQPTIDEPVAIDNRSIIMPESGLVQPRSYDIGEIYLKHAIDGADDELTAMVYAISSQRPVEAPPAVPLFG